MDATHAAALPGQDAAHPDGQYGTVAKWFHWITVGLIAIALPTGFVIKFITEASDSVYKMGFYAIHESAGLTILLTAFGRAVAEVGAVMIVGGNIAGATRVMTTAIALETSKGDLPLALALGLVLLGVVGSLHLLIALVRWRAAEAGAGRGTREAWA